MSELENLPLKEDKIKLGFETETVTLRLDQIIPLKVIAPNIREKAKYKQIFASIKEVGIIEPPAVTPCNDKSGRYYLLDGHLRIEALKDLKEKQIMPADPNTKII